jgi:hypothetical protein
VVGLFIRKLHGRFVFPYDSIKTRRKSESAVLIVLQTAVSVAVFIVMGRVGVSY